MTTVQSSTSSVSQALLDSVNGTSSSAKSSTESTQDRFMTLLITQMKNQDPLNPMDNAQVTSQMAQLSTVTGIDKLNTTVESLMSSMQSGQSYQAANMIGHNVLVAGNTVTTTGTGGYLGADLAGSADSVSVAIKNASGTTVRTINLGAQAVGNLTVKWDGLADDGSKAASGDYKFQITALSSGKSVTTTNLNYAEVTSVSNSTNGIKLNLSNSTSISTSDVKEIY